MIKCGDSSYLENNQICSGGNSKQMFFDTINPQNIYKIFKLYKRVSPDTVFIISSHTFNIVSLILGRLIFRNITFVSHIHDPIAHSGTWYSHIIYYSQKIQTKLSQRVVCYGKKLKQIICDSYNINSDKVYVIKHGVYRPEIENTVIVNKKNIFRF